MADELTDEGISDAADGIMKRLEGEDEDEE